MHDHDPAHVLKHALAGVGAGLAGTAVMFAMRTFDSKYATKTLVHGDEDPGMFVVRHGEQLVGGKLPKHVELGASIATHVTYGTTYGVLYALARLLGSKKTGHHPFVFGGLLGGIVYLIGYAGILPGVGLAKPITDETFPEVAGELTRHVAYGIATVTAYDVIHDAL